MQLFLFSIFCEQHTGLHPTLLEEVQWLYRHGNRVITERTLTCRLDESLSTNSRWMPPHINLTSAPNAVDQLRLHYFIQFSWFEKFKFNHQTIVTCETSVFWLDETCKDRCMTARLQMSKSSAD